jgi:hypothetical protein
MPPISVQQFSSPVIRKPILSSAHTINISFPLKLHPQHSPDIRYLLLPHSHNIFCHICHFLSSSPHKSQVIFITNVSVTTVTFSSSIIFTQNISIPHLTHHASFFILHNFCLSQIFPSQLSLSLSQIVSPSFVSNAVTSLSLFICHFFASFLIFHTLLILLFNKIIMFLSQILCHFSTPYSSLSSQVQNIPLHLFIIFSLQIACHNCHIHFISSSLRYLQRSHIPKLPCHIVTNGPSRFITLMPPTSSTPHLDILPSLSYTPMGNSVVSHCHNHATKYQKSNHTGSPVYDMEGSCGLPGTWEERE